MSNFFLFLCFVTLGYFSGSICSAVMVSRIFGLPDPRVEGSQNPGATNVLRLAGKKYALIVLLTDVLKGLLPVAFANMLHMGPIITSFTCFAAVFGHMYPIFFGFHGGKGVAAAIGAFLGLQFMVGITTIGTWLLVANFTRYSSLASLVSMSLAPIYALLITGNVYLLPPLFCITIFVLYKHRNNITRLIEKKEPKISFKKHQLSDLFTEKEIEKRMKEEDK